jgi:hypothetical protein
MQDPMLDEEERLVAARYLAGLLSPADSLRFEQSVKDDPAVLDRLRLGEQIARGSRLVDVDRLGLKPPWWHDRRVAIGAAGVIGILLIACIWLASSASIARERMAMMQAREQQGFLAPPSSTRTVRVSADAGGNISLGGRAPERVEIRIEARSNKFNQFRVAIQRDDGTAVLHFDRLQRDSNGELRLALNSTLLPPGSYSLRIEGFTWRGDTEPVGKIRLSVR